MNVTPGVATSEVVVVSSISRAKTLLAAIGSSAATSSIIVLPNVEVTSTRSSIVAVSVIVLVNRIDGDITSEVVVVSSISRVNVLDTRIGSSIIALSRIVLVKIDVTPMKVFVITASTIFLPKIVLVTGIVSLTDNASFIFLSKLAEDCKIPDVVAESTIRLENEPDKSINSEIIMSSIIVLPKFTVISIGVSNVVAVSTNSLL